MDKKQYQFGLSEKYRDRLYDGEKRAIKAQKTLSILRDYFLGEGREMKSLSLLDIGCSNGFMTELYGGNFKDIVGIDIDAPAVEYAQKRNSSPNIRYLCEDAMNTNFESESFDVITCSHIYEHVPDSKKLFLEIYRLLKKGGICFFAAGNRNSLIEAHYKLPLLSVIPKPLSHFYLRLLGRDRYYYEKHLSLWGLKKIVSSFEIIDYTLKIIRYPEKYSATDMIRQGSLKQKIFLALCHMAYWLCPTYIWVLRKN